ncbi:putative ABC-type xenobiotic transporter [Helianthus debilis subsp. tardiflorus]
MIEGGDLTGTGKGEGQVFGTKNINDERHESLEICKDKDAKPQVWLSAIISQRGVYLMLFWLSPTIVACVTSYTCNYIGIPLDATNAFTFLATIQIIQEPIHLIADTAAVLIEARVALTRILKFLETPELQKEQKKHVNV